MNHEGTKDTKKTPIWKSCNGNTDISSSVKEQWQRIPINPFTPDSQTVITVDWEIIKLWSVQTGQVINTLDAYAHEDENGYEDEYGDEDGCNYEHSTATNNPNQPQPINYDPALSLTDDEDVHRVELRHNLALLPVGVSVLEGLEVDESCWESRAVETPEEYIIDDGLIYERWC